MDSDYVPGSRREDLERVALRNSSDVVHFDTAKEFLRNTKVSSIFPAQRTKILKVKSDTALGDALQIFIHEKILSMPVYDDQGRTYIGFIDLLDVVYHIVETLKGEQLTDAGFSLLMKTSHSLSNSTCGYVAGASGRNPFYPIDEHAPLMAAIQLMADNHVQRIPVLSNATREDLATIITQSHVARLILDNIEKFEIKDKTVDTLKVGNRNLITIDKREKAISAFKLIHDNKVSGIAVIDRVKGTLYGNISASDINQIGEDAGHISRLFLSIEEYLGIVCGGKAPTPFAVHLSTTFVDVLRQMINRSVHRIYITDAENKPIGVISLTDILVTIVEHL